MSISKASSVTTGSSKKTTDQKIEDLKAKLAEKGWQIAERVTPEGTLQIIAKKASNG